MKKVLLIGNHDIVIYNFRLEFIEELLKRKNEVYIALPYGEKVENLKKIGCQYYEIKMERHGTNIFQEIGLLTQYSNILQKIQPDIAFTYTIKPNIYGSLACKIKKIPCVPTITGLGTAVEQKGILQKLIILLYQISFKSVQTVFFQNKENLAFFKENKINLPNYQLVNGSGVNLERFSYLQYPQNTHTKFLFIGRVMKEKGIEEYLNAAERIKEKYTKVEFYICGFMEGEYENIIKKYENKEVITYLGMVQDIRKVLKEIDCVILPSYHEGMSNALLEASATGRPILASDIPGCREIFDEGMSGFGFQAKSTKSLVEAIERFLSLSYEEKEKMGIKGRERVEKYFNRENIVNAYIEEIGELKKNI